VRWVDKPREMGVPCFLAPMCIIKSGDLDLGHPVSAKKCKKPGKLST
jgi:hypothetical protein